MPFNPDAHHRRSIRLNGYDYTQNGAYFVTICIQNRLCLFGDVVEGEMQLSEAGKMINDWWHELANKFPQIEIDEYVVMPNHFHGIVVIVGADLRVCPPIEGAHTGAPLQKIPPSDNPSLSKIVQWFKTMTTNAYIRGVKEQGWLPFEGKLWQRNCHERIIRDERELNDTRQYIEVNPARWAEDIENPAFESMGG